LFIQNLHDIKKDRIRELLAVLGEDIQCLAGLSGQSKIFERRKDPRP